MLSLESTIEQLKSRLMNATLDDIPVEGHRRAAVALVLRARPAASGVEVLLIRRADNPRDFWSGQMALPGGRWDPTDANLLETAIRETHEEVGLVLDAERFVGRLDSLHPVSRRLPMIDITPFVALAPPAAQVISNHEVAAHYWIDLEHLRRTGASATHAMDLGGEHFEWPAYPFGDSVIWGLTERILTRFLALLASDG